VGAIRQAVSWAGGDEKWEVGLPNKAGLAREGGEAVLVAER